MATYFRLCKWTDEIGKYASDKLDQIKANISSEPALESLSKIWPRLAISVKKISKTIACVNHRATILKSDVDEAFSFVQYKIDYIAKMSYDSPADDPADVEEVPVENRKDKIIQILKVGPMATKTLVEKVNQWSDKEFDRKTISRDLKILEREGRIISKKQGYWQLSEV